MVTKLEVVSLKKHPTLNERWVQEQILADPSCLQLGDLAVKDKERSQARAGRLDMLLYDPASLKRFEVELQLGALDESHIIRAIEYWDLERGAYPMYSHACVVVAEDVTSRFLNVIQIINGTIPLIVLKMTAYKVGDDYALTFVKIIDERTLGAVGEDEPVDAPADEAYWLAKASTASMDLVRSLVETTVRPSEPQAQLRPTKHYIGLTVDGVAANFVSFIPRKAWVIMAIKLPSSAEYDALVAESGLAAQAYDTQFGNYRLSIQGTPTTQQLDALKHLAAQAATLYFC